MVSRIHQPLESDEFDFVLGRADGPVLAYFCGTWPKAVKACKELDAVVAEVAGDYEGRLTVVRADMTRCPGPTRRYGVTGAPTVVLIRNAEVTKLEPGPVDGAGLREFLESHL